MNSKVDFYFSEGKWHKELKELRRIILDCGLTEELKWGCPCYASRPRSDATKASNIVLIHAFKGYCALLFFKGALLSNRDGILIQQTKNVQAARQIRFVDIREVNKLTPIIKAYIYEALEVEKAGLKVTLKKTPAFIIPEEFKKILNKNVTLRTAFKALTPGRQRAYLLYFSAPKQSKTRESRIEKYSAQILGGKGLND